MNNLPTPPETIEAAPAPLLSLIKEFIKVAEADFAAGPQGVENSPAGRLVHAIDKEYIKHYKRAELGRFWVNILKAVNI